MMLPLLLSLNILAEGVVAADVLPKNEAGELATFPPKILLVDFGGTEPNKFVFSGAFFAADKLKLSNTDGSTVLLPKIFVELC